MTDPKRVPATAPPLKAAKDTIPAGHRTGRPRSTEAHRRVIEAALSVANRLDYQDITMEMVAREAEVAKTTLYRWWKSKAELMLEATSEPLKTPDTGCLRGDLADLLNQYAHSHLQEAGSHVELGLWADLRRTPADPRATDLQQAHLQHERDVIKEVLDRALENGELLSHHDCDLALSLLKGLPRHLRLVLGVDQTRISNDYLVGCILAGLQG
ncbi:MAG: TetR/AcrR family transcriptional regulator [Planctomycetota bacterium]|nr:TetR/AcrR family transcriptional regulator [Planctomycetota bacterium]